MRVLVTGSEGFIGRYIVKELQECGMDVIRADLPQTSSHTVNYYSADITDAAFCAQLAPLLGHCDAVVHTAALLTKDLFNDRVLAVNCGGTAQVLQLAAALKAKKLVNISSIQINDTAPPLPITEDRRANPHSWYHLTKLLQEDIIAFAANLPMDAYNLRITAPVGIGMDQRTILPVLLQNCLNNTPMVLAGRGGRRQNYIGASDIAKAVRLCLTQQVKGGIYNIASDEAVSNRDVAAICKAVTGSASVITYSGQDDPQEEHNWQVSTVKAWQELGFKAEEKLPDLLLQLANHMREQSE